MKATKLFVGIFCLSVGIFLYFCTFKSEFIIVKLY